MYKAQGLITQSQLDGCDLKKKQRLIEDIKQALFALFYHNFGFRLTSKIRNQDVFTCFMIKNPLAERITKANTDVILKWYDRSTYVGIKLKKK